MPQARATATVGSKQQHCLEQDGNSSSSRRRSSSSNNSCSSSGSLLSPSYSITPPLYSPVLRTK